MKNLTALALVGLLALAGCGQDTPVPETPNHMAAGSSLDLSSTSAFLTVTEACGTNAVVWTYSGASIVGYAPTIDGRVDQTGFFNAPVCGSTLLGTTVTITARCSTVPTAVATASITVGQELVTAVTLVAADVKVCGGAVCRASNPSAIVIPVCAPPPAPQTTIQWYARIDTTCGTAAAFSPSAPPTGIPACTF